ncbi:MAG: aminoacyl-tRNA hydrolase [bacterium]
MNNSGIAVLQAMKQFSFEIGDLIAVVDDFNIPAGTMRLREKGSAGGHNGLKSIIYHLETDNFARLRVGIGTENASKDREFVLSCFDDPALLNKIIADGVDAMERIVEIGVPRAMNFVNKKNSDTVKQEEQVD